jgi:hypothetical protein
MSPIVQVYIVYDSQITPSLKHVTQYVFGYPTYHLYTALTYIQTIQTRQ